jgi:hypothetical protein
MSSTVLVIEYGHYKPLHQKYCSLDSKLVMRPDMSVEREKGGK